MSLTYNADGQRVIKTSTDGSQTGFLYDQQRLLHETDDVGTITQSYVSETTEEFGNLIGEDGGYVHQYDAQAKTDAMIDGTGTFGAQFMRAKTNCVPVSFLLSAGRGMESEPRSKRSWR